MRVSEPRAPLFLIAGGGASPKRWGPDPVMEEAIARIGVPRPEVAYLGAASGDDPAFRVSLSGVLKKAGAARVVLAPLCGKRADSEVARKVLADSDLVFVSGGDVDEGMQVLRRAGMTAFLKTLHRAGKPFLGVSAGSIMLARRWIRWRDPRDDSSAELFPCLGLAPVLCDTHGEAEGWEELRTLLMLSPVGAMGYGIASGTALVFEPDGSIAAVGGEVARLRRRVTGVVQGKPCRPGSG